MDFSLYLVTDRCRGTRAGVPMRSMGQRGSGGIEKLIGKVKAALEGGVKAVCLREKDLPAREILTLALRLRQLTSGFNAALFINSRVDVALAIRADGIHLGQNSFSPKDVRPLIGKKTLIGVSAHSIKEALQAERDGADFVTLGPVYRTPSKEKYGEPIGLLPLEKASKVLRIPFFGIGGIKKENIKEVLEAGASGVALISGILSAKNPEKATKEIIQELKLNKG